MARTITAIRAQRGSRRRLNIFIDNEYAFSLAPALAAELHVGQVLEDDAIADLQSRDAVERAYERVLRYLALRPRSEAEVRRYLEAKGLASESEEVLARLKRARLVDDEAFARFWVENREQFRPRGVWALRYELRQKGVDQGVIDKAVQEVDELSGAMRVAERVVHRYATLDRETFWRRLYGYLRRRGFAYSTIRQVVEELWRRHLDEA